MSTSGSKREMCVRGEVARRLSAARVGHSESVAALAEQLCLRFGVPPCSGRLAGLAHDLAREMDIESIRSLASRDGMGFDEDEEACPLLLHGRAAAVLLESDLGVNDPEVLAAVREHVTGRPGMGKLASIIYAADFLEPLRLFVPEERRRELLAGSLREMVRGVMEMTVAYLEGQGRPVARVSHRLAQYLEREAYGSQGTCG